MHNRPVNLGVWFCNEAVVRGTHIIGGNGDLFKCLRNRTSCGNGICEDHLCGRQESKMADLSPE